MLGIRNIIYKKNNDYIAFCFGGEIKFTYNDISEIIDNKLASKYLESLFLIINSWENEYINIETIDGDDWELNIAFLDGNSKLFKGHADYPNNFEFFEKLNQTIIDEVIR